MPREKLPNRRASHSRSFVHEGTKYHATYSRFADGRLAEVFISAGKVGTSLNVMARDLALVTSLALQFGAPQTTITQALEQELTGEMRGPLGVLLQLIGEQA